MVAHTGVRLEDESPVLPVIHSRLHVVDALDESRGVHARSARRSNGGLESVLVPEQRHGPRVAPAQAELVGQSDRWEHVRLVVGDEGANVVTPRQMFGHLGRSTQVDQIMGRDGIAAEDRLASGSLEPLTTSRIEAHAAQAQVLIAGADECGGVGVERVEDDDHGLHARPPPVESNRQSAWSG